MLLLLKQCGGGGVWYQRCSWLVRDWTLTCRLQATQLRALHQTSLNKCNSVQRFKLDLQASEQKDHLLYVAQSTKYYRLMNLFAITQFVFWFALGYSMLEMKTVEVPQKTKQDETLPWWRKYDFSYYKRPMSIAAFIIGCLLFAAILRYTLRCVHHLTLLRDGKTIAFTTSNIWGRPVTRRVPVDQAHLERLNYLVRGYDSCLLHVRGTRVAYALDMRGKLHEPFLIRQYLGTEKENKEKDGPLY